jgi:uncharacterized protein YutE (UPF0331/DUF86 family)
MARSTVTTGQKSLDDAAREYESKGYRVVKEPDSTQLPDFLTGFRPDLIAYDDEENVVVEVKSNTILPQSHDLVSLADVINATSGWRFDLIVTAPSTGEEATSLDWWGIRRRIADARELLDGQEDAAAILAWSAAEATMRLVTEQHHVSLGSTQRNTPLYLVKKLSSLGLLSREDHDVFAESIQLRNRIIHGYRSQGPTREEVQRLIDSVEHLLAEVPPQPMH